MEKKTYICPTCRTHRLGMVGDIAIGVPAVKSSTETNNARSGDAWSDDSDAASGGSSSNGSIWSEGW